MARRYYDKFGRLKGYSKTSKEERAETITLIIVAAIIAPFVPLIITSIFIFNLIQSTGAHDLFSTLAGACCFVLGLYFLWRSILFRYAYFGLSTAILAGIVFAATSDKVWGTFFALMTLFVGGAVTWGFSLLPHGGEEQSTSNSATDEPAEQTYSLVSGAIEQNVLAHDPKAECFSYPLDDVEAEALVSKLNESSIELLQILVSDADGDFAILTWSEVQEITGTRDWSHMTRSIVAQVHRHLRSVTANSDASLFFDTRDIEGDDYEDERCLMIDGPAVAALKRALSNLQSK